MLRVLRKDPGWRADTGQSSETVQAFLEREEAPAVSHLVPSPPEPGGTLPSSSLSARLEQSVRPAPPAPGRQSAGSFPFPLAEPFDSGKEQGGLEQGAWAPLRVPQSNVGRCQGKQTLGTLVR